MVAFGNLRIADSNIEPPMDTEPMTQQNRKSLFPMEFYFGTAVGFLLASLMLNATYGWAAGIYPIPVLVMSIVGFIVGKVRQRFWTVAMYSRRYFKYRRWIFLSIWFLCALGPYCGMKTYYVSKAATLPIPSGWTRTEFQTAVLSWDSPPGFYIRIERDGANADNALGFYQQYFESKGWSGGNVICEEETFEKYTRVHYKKPWSPIGILIGYLEIRFLVFKHFAYCLGNETF